MSLFFKPQVQDILKSLTGLNYEKIFRVSRIGARFNPPSYVFMTDKQLKEAQKEAKENALKRLQMPPVLSQRKDQVQILDKDPAIVGFDSAKYIFTDITFGVHDRDRIIVAREPDGTLRGATWAERDRMNQIYFPTEGRKFKIPAFFHPDTLKEILGPEKYEYVLDRNCVQFEPDHPIFIRTAQAVYDHVDIHGNYQVLHSTRHYGPMVFYLVSENRIDDLIKHYLSNLNLFDACQVVQLYSIFHPNSRLEKLEDYQNEEEMLKFMRSYIKNESKKETKLHITLESMCETMKRNSKAVNKMS